LSKPAVIVATSHVVRGSVGGRAAVFALERMGFPVWSLPTVILPWHPGQGGSTRLSHEPGDFAAAAGEIATAAGIGEVVAMFTGYLGSAAQLEPLAVLVAALKVRNRAAVYLCDPVIGDAAGLFQPEALANELRTRLIPMADIATPNRHELAWLTGTSAEDNGLLVAAARSLGAGEVVVTSAFAPEGEIGTLLVTAGDAHLATHRKLPNVSHGTGDLFAALYLGHRLDGIAAIVALERAAASVLRVIEHAAKTKADQLPLADAQETFLAAPTGVTVRPVAAARGRHPA